MEIKAIERSIDESLSAFAARGVEVVGYPGDVSSPCGWMFRFSTCWKFGDQVATVRVRCMAVGAGPDHPSELKVITTAEIARSQEVATVCDRWSRVVRCSDAAAIGMLEFIEAELVLGAKSLTAMTDGQFAAADRSTPH